MLTLAQKVVAGVTIVVIDVALFAVGGLLFLIVATLVSLPMMGRLLDH